LRALLLSILSSLILFGLLSCQSSPEKKDLKPAPQDARSLLSSAQNDLARSHEKQAIAKLRRITAAHPGTDAADTAWTLLGRLSLKNRDYKSAAPEFLQVLNGPTKTQYEEEAYLGACRSLTQIGRVDEALSLSAKGLAGGHLSPNGQYELQKLRYPLLKETGDLPGALKALVATQAAEKDSVQRELWKNKAFELANKLQKGDLQMVVDNGDFGFVRGFAAYRLATFFMDQHDFERARSLFEKTLEYTPNSNVAANAAAQIQQIDGRKQIDPYTIGAILPLGGQYDAVAQKTLHGLQLGLGVFGPSRSSFKLAVIDGETSPEDAKKSVDTLVGEDHVIAVVGSLLSRNSVAVAVRANELGVPSVALSQKAGITEVGNTVFRNAITSQMQVQYLVKTAMEDQGMRKFAILFPNDTYGVEYANLFWNEVEKRGGHIVGAQPYNASETDFRAPVKRLVGTYYLEDRQVEYKNRLKEWFKNVKNPKASGRNSAPEDLLPPILDFDGLFVPDGPKAMGQIAPMLAYVGVQNVHFLGTNLWNSPDFLRRGQRFVEKALFVDAEASVSAKFSTTKFYNDFKQTFGSEPGMFELQGYETGTLLARLINDGERSRLGLAERMARMERAPGVLGPMQMSTERELIWPMTAFTVKDGQIAIMPKQSAL
jgi:ABC-type branched-subunit amino acid transport system substrate-binding protein